MRPSAYLPAGNTLVSWLSAGSRAGDMPRIALWTYRWKAHWFDGNWERQRRLHPVAGFEGADGSHLVFVMGFWRSGTTLLHELLAAGPRMAAPRTWQCMNPSGFRIGSPPATRAPKSRPMDAVVIHALSPQEDEFALLARGAPSVYRAWLDPRRWQEVLPALSQDTWLSLPRQDWFDDWRTFLGWCLPPEASALAIKSPNHVFRLKALRRAWPRARYVWTLRDPVETWLSNRKMWGAMTSLYGLAPWRPEDLDRLLFQAFEQYAAALKWATESLNPDSSVYVGFDRLTTATAEVLRDITGRLNLGDWSDWMSLARERLEESSRYPRETYSTTSTLPEYAAGVIGEIREAHRRVLCQ